MGIFADILHKIFPSNHPAVTGSGGASPTATGIPGTVAATAPASTPASASTPMPEVDVEQVLTALAQKNPEKLNWRTSIVDLMKLLSLDSSIAARKSLAAELHYSGSTDDSASMNIWLHKQVMNKLAENGGRVPADLKS